MSYMVSDYFSMTFRASTNTLAQMINCRWLQSSLINSKTSSYVQLAVSAHISFSHITENKLHVTFYRVHCHLLCKCRCTCQCTYRSI